MFLATAKGYRWMTVAAVIAVACLVVYALQPEGAPRHGGSVLGLVLGVLAFLLTAVLLYFGVRKRRYRSTLGTLTGWLQAHIYLGLLVLLVALLHSGFRFEDRVATAAFLCMALVVASGIVGTVAYSVVPRLLTDIESNLTAEEISQQLNQLAGAMAGVASGKSGPFQRVFQGLMREARPGRLAGWGILLGRSARRKLRGGDDEGWAAVLNLVQPEEREELRRMLVLSRQHKELHLRLVQQQRYRNLMDFWLFLHLPLSLALVVLVVAHAVAALRYAL